LTGAHVLVDSVLLEDHRPSARESDSEAGRTELRCYACGYGAVVSGLLPACPMCQASVWEQLPRRPFAAVGSRPAIPAHTAA